MKLYLGQLLVENEQITPAQLKQAEQEATQTEEPIGTVLLRLGLVNEDIIKTVLELHYAVNYLNLKKVHPDLKLVGLLPREVIVENELIPISKEDSRLTLAMVHPTDQEALARVKVYLSDWQIHTVVCSDDAFNDFVLRSMPQGPIPKRAQSRISATVAPTITSNPAPVVSPKPIAPAAPIAPAIPSKPTSFIRPKPVPAAPQPSPLTATGKSPGDLGLISIDDDANSTDQDAAIVRLCNHILSNAISKTCSNIHIEPAERQILVHYRKEGVLFSAQKLPRTILPDLIRRFKNMASAGESQETLPFDGRLSIRHAGQIFFFRLSIVPGAYGEHLVIWLE